MNMKAAKAIVLSSLMIGWGMAFAADRELKLTAPLSPVSYQKVSSGFGALDNTWKLTGVMAFDGETAASLKLDWKRGAPYVRTYSVVPVYTAFGESWKGTKASVTVEYDRHGMVLIMR